MRTLKKPEYSRMRESFRITFAPQYSKAIHLFFIFQIIQSVFYTAGAMPFIILEDSTVTRIISIVFLGIANTASWILFGGALKVVTNVCLKKKIEFSLLFWCFKNSFKKFLCTAIIFALCTFCSFGIVFLIMKSNSSIVVQYITNQEMNRETFLFIASFALLFGTITILLCLPFVFIWNILFENENESIVNAIKKNFSYSLPNYFHFIGFEFYMCWINFLVIFIATLISYKIPDNAFILSFLISLYIFFQEYALLVKAAACIPIYYFSIVYINSEKQIDIVINEETNVELKLESEENNSPVIQDDDE